MAWIQVYTDSSAEHASSYEALLFDHDALSVTMTDRADTPVLEPLPGETPIWPDTRVNALYPADIDLAALLSTLQQAARAKQLDDSFRYEALEDKDWQKEWTKYFEPIAFGERLWVCPSWRPIPNPDAVNLRLDPGLAFGTGSHPTTALCLEWLEKRISSSDETAGATENHQRLIVDYGCGSGILAIAALLLGCERGCGVDLDPQAIYATRQNAELNHIHSDRLCLFTSEDFDSDSWLGQADYVLANILAGPLITLAPIICGLCKPGGSICLSGIVSNQIDRIFLAYAPWISFDSPVYKEEWVMLSGRRED